MDTIVTPMDEIVWVIQAFLPIVLYFLKRVPKDSYGECEMLDE